MTKAEAIKYLEQHRHSNPCGRKVLEESNEAIDMAIEALTNVQNMHKGNWIPVSERLPETVSHNLVSNGDMTWAALWQENDWYGVGFPAAKLNDVIAWMPLPEPYKAEREEV